MSHDDLFSEQAATWDDDPGHVQRATAVAAVVRDAVPLRPDMNVIEIGGGTGLLSRALVDDIATASVTDVAPGMVDAAANALDDPRYEGWEAKRYDIEHDPLPDERYDLVLGLLTLHHMGDVPAVVRRCADLLQPGGWVALADLDHDPHGDFHAHVHEFHGHVHEFHGHDGFRREAIEGWLSDAGFEDVSTTDAGAVTKATEDGERDFPMFLTVGRRP